MAILGVDIGTQSLKAVITDHDLGVLGQASRPYAVRHPRPGWAEQDVRDFEAALAPSVAEAVHAAGIRPTDVRAIGIAGQLDGCVAVDERGHARTPCLIWMDRRATGELPAAILDDRERFSHTTGLVADATHMAAKIRWLKGQGLGNARFHQPVSYLVERLTGAFVFDHGLASTTMLYALQARDYDDTLLAAFAITRDELPRIDRAGACAGRLTSQGSELIGLPAGIPVAVGTGDDFATPLGAGVIAPGTVACVIGTAEVVGALSHAPIIDEHGLVETHGYASPCFFIENPGWLSGGAMTWLGNLLSVHDAGLLDQEAAGVPAAGEGLLFLPALSGAMAPAWIASARGCFYGLTPAHGRGHLARAVMEGCAFAMRDVVTRLAELGVPGRSITIMGGGARSRLWGQIRADLTGLPVELCKSADTCPVGAAMLAAVAADIQPDLDHAARLVARERMTLTPDPGQRALYDDAYGRYRLLFESLRPVY